MGKKRFTSLRKNVKKEGNHLSPQKKGTKRTKHQFVTEERRKKDPD